MNSASLRKSQFDELSSQGYNRIAVYRVLELGDHTALSIFRCFNRGSAGSRQSFLLESMRGLREESDAVSIVGLAGELTLTVEHGRLQVLRNGIVEEVLPAADPFAALRAWNNTLRAPSTVLPGGFRLPFNGGLVGYFAYDLLRYVEPRLRDSEPADRSFSTPDIQLFQCDQFIVTKEDAEGNRLMIPVVCVDPGAPDSWQLAQSKLDELEGQLAATAPVVESPHLSDEEQKVCEDPAIEGETRSSLSESEYTTAVERIREYIYAGDVMQVVPSRRIEVPLQRNDEAPVDALDLYCAIRSMNPPRYRRYMYFMDFGTHQLAGASPETLVQLQGSEITTCPIAGTRRRGRTSEEDQEMADELLADPKEIAEHLMLIDLGRNDVGRVSTVGSVKVPWKMRMQVELYSHVMHITSRVTGEVKSELDALDVLRAILPAGTLSGAPKIRAMEIIDEFEPVRRGFYGGAVGYLSWDGNMNTAVAIRTALVKQGKMFAQAGGGIVADSIPALEWKETSNKARGMLRALALARHRASVGARS